ncbi:hypothetical protein ABZS29_12075 [Kribbella sp. NPDC005582]|uniref:hypothetical protein n=1 Tax=Kribbella sp. NPDC005582 TaxID=3156893 RepID=UPI0033A7C93A
MAPYTLVAFHAHPDDEALLMGGALGLLLKLPRWLFRRMLGHEWFVEHGRTPGAPLDDLFSTLRDS